MRSRTLVVLVALTLTGGVLFTLYFLRPAREGAWRPHVVLVIIDTLRADRLGSYGYGKSTSPELDALTRRGIRMAQTVSQSSWTRSSIGSLLTSIHPRSLGIFKEREGILNDRFTTLAEVLRDNGYRTLGATANPHLNRSFNFQQGFDYYLDSTEVWDWMDGAYGQVPTDSPALLSAMQLFERVLSVLEEEDDHHRGAPHYLQFDLMEVHENYGSNDLVRPEFKEYFGGVQNQRERRYLQAVRQISYDIDWLVRSLSTRNGWEDILFVFVSDHGEGLTSHPHVPSSESHGLLLYESQMMVPWVLYSTSETIPRGQVIQQRVRLLEVMPTLLDLLGIEPPPGTRGVSLEPLLMGTGSISLPEEFFVETQFYLANKMGVYTSQWKLFSNRDGHRGLNNLELQPIGIAEDGIHTDVGEEHPEVRERLELQLRLWESRHPRIPPTLSGEPLPDEVIEQLRSLGYLH